MCFGTRCDTALLNTAYIKGHIHVLPNLSEPVITRLGQTSVIAKDREIHLAGFPGNLFLAFTRKGHVCAWFIEGIWFFMIIDGCVNFPLDILS